MEDFTGKVVIVTGAAQGIGRETSLQFARAGAQLVLADFQAGRLDEARAQVARFAPEAVAVVTDVRVWADAVQMAGAAVDRFGRIDVLVNNAGVDLIDPGGKQFTIEEIPDEEYDRVVATNMKGSFNCTKAVVPYMKRQMSGRIVNISSVVGLSGGFGSAVYCGSKAGIMAQTKVMARELGPFGICVNCVAPGMVDTPMHTYTPQENFAMVAGRVPLRRVGQPADIARVVLFFAADGIFFTGQTLCVDGGGVMH